MNGSSTGCPPIHVRMKALVIHSQNKILVSGRNAIVRCFAVCISGIIKRMRIDMSKAKTPPSLFGIERRMAYANRKYHSGLIWGGVTSGFAGVKLSGSPSKFGEKVARLARARISIAKPRISL